MRLPILAEYKYFQNAADKLDQGSEMTNEILQICQDYWGIPLVLSVVAIAAYAMLGGEKNKSKAKERLMYACIATAIIMFAVTIVSIILGLFTPDEAATLGQAVAGS